MLEGATSDNDNDKEIQVHSIMNIYYGCVLERRAEPNQCHIYLPPPSVSPKEKTGKIGGSQETEWKVKIFMPFHIKMEVLKKVFTTVGEILFAVQRAQGQEWTGIASSLNGNLIKIKRS